MIFLACLVVGFGTVSFNFQEAALYFCLDTFLLPYVRTGALVSRGTNRELLGIAILKVRIDGGVFFDRAAADIRYCARASVHGVSSLVLVTPRLPSRR